jgi:hypothetical protein
MLLVDGALMHLILNLLTSIAQFTYLFFAFWLLFWFIVVISFI